MDLSDLAALLGDTDGPQTGADLWVVLPAGGQGAGLALLGEARRLAGGLGCFVQAVVASPDDAGPAIAGGADRVHVTASAVDYLVGQHPEFVLFTQSDVAAAARYAQLAGAGLVTGVPGRLTVDEQTRELVAEHPVYGGDYFQVVAVTSAIKVAAVVVDALPVPPADPTRTGETIIAASSPVSPAWRDLGPAGYSPPAWPPLSKARMIVSVGRGLKDEAGVALARRLARLLDAELAGDRSALAAGWIDAEQEIGVTGYEVSPKVYVALGLRGDTVHNAAIAEARLVIAVHPDPAAPIFHAADLGVIADPLPWLKLLLSALETGAPSP